MRTRTRAELLAQLENEQAAGDPHWDQPADRPELDALLHILAREIAPYLDDTPEVVRLHRRARPVAA